MYVCQENIYIYANTGTFKIINKILFKNVTFVLSILETEIGGQDRVVVKRPHGEDKDVGSDPAAPEKTDIGEPPYRR